MVVVRRERGWEVIGCVCRVFNFGFRWGGEEGMGFKFDAGFFCFLGRGQGGSFLCRGLVLGRKYGLDVLLCFLLISDRVLAQGG